MQVADNENDPFLYNSQQLLEKKSSKWTISLSLSFYACKLVKQSCHKEMINYLYTKSAASYRTTLIPFCFYANNHMGKD